MSERSCEQNFIICNDTRRDIHRCVCIHICHHEKIANIHHDKIIHTYAHACVHTHLYIMIRLHLEISVIHSKNYHQPIQFAVILSISRAQVHVFLHSDLEQFLYSYHFPSLTTCLVSVICCYGND